MDMWELAHFTIVCANHLNVKALVITAGQADGTVGGFASGFMSGFSDGIVNDFAYRSVLRGRIPSMRLYEQDTIPQNLQSGVRRNRLLLPADY
jgi:hypothetical protein